jgi:hypothetical protein
MECAWTVATDGPALALVGALAGHAQVLLMLDNSGMRIAESDTSIPN